MLLTTTTCFGPQVAIVRLCTLKWILSTMCNYKLLKLKLKKGETFLTAFTTVTSKDLCSVVLLR
jgi:hypothetical protein